MGTNFNLYVVRGQPDAFELRHKVCFMIDLGKNYDLAIDLGDHPTFEDLGDTERIPNTDLEYAFSNFHKIGCLPILSAIEVLKDAQTMTMEKAILAILNNMFFNSTTPLDLWVVLERDQ